MNDLSVIAVRPELPAVGKFTREAKMVAIDSEETYKFADDQLVILKTFAKNTEAERMKAVGPLNALHAVIQSWFKPVLDDCEAAEKVYKAAMIVYRKTQQEADDLRQAGLDKAAREERERLQKMAEKAEKRGDLEKAAVLNETAAVIVAPTLTSTFVAPKGSSFIKAWKARIKGDESDAIVAVARYVAEHPDYFHLLKIDLADATRVAKMQEAKFNIPGLEAYQDETMSRRAA